MEGKRAQLPGDAIARALAYLEAAEACRFTGRRPPPKPKLKPLVLQVAPAANVRRTAAAHFECFIGARRVHVRGCSQGHPTPDRAWICLARYVTSPAFVAATETV